MDWSIYVLDFGLPLVGESTHLQPVWFRFDFQTQCHMWVESFGSLLYSERFFPGYSGLVLSSKIYI